MRHSPASDDTVVRARRGSGARLDLLFTTDEGDLRMRSRWNVVWAAVALIGLASSAHAQEGDPEAGDLGTEAEVSTDEAAPAADSGEKPISVGLLLGYGVSLEDGPNPWGLGFGLRGGYNIDAIFVGARFVYYLGESIESPAGDSTLNIWELGLELGYDIDAGGVTIRPALGLGLASLNVDTPLGSGSESEFFIAPGASVLYDVTDSIFLGLDLRFQLILAEETVKGIPILATVGMRF
jgi:hypothetical protein